MALVKEVCLKSPNSQKEWDGGTEGRGEILTTELNLPHKYYPKFHVGPNLQRTRSLSVGSCLLLLLLKAVLEAS